MEDVKGGSDFVIGELLEMGFEHALAVEAVKVVGPSINDATEYIFNDSCRYSHSACTSSGNAGKASGKKSSIPSLSGRVRQSSILDHFKSPRQSKRGRICTKTSLPASQTNPLPDPVEEEPELPHDIEYKPNMGLELSEVKCPQDVEFESDWESKVSSILRRHFGYSSLKDFQKEALAAWVAHQDCLVLAATGAGKSMCFQIPALLTGKVVVVISPLISLMHDQCLKLVKHGVSACFLGSGQPDNSVEQKAMNGMYSLVYICPETVLRLIEGLKKLAAGRGIALFAIDEVHCVSKWGHDFRPDYRKLSVLRENFSAYKLKFLKSDIPLMALTATATARVQQDVIESLHMSNETKTVLTSFFRPNLRFSVMHSRTSSPASYQNDFCELINSYSPGRKNVQNWKSVHTKCLDEPTSSSSSSDCPISEMDCVRDNREVTSARNGSRSLGKKTLSVEFLEDEVDVFHGVDDWDVSCGEFCVQSLDKDCGLGGPVDKLDPPLSLEERVKLQQQPLEDGVTIIYVPTRKETLLLAKFLSGHGIKAAAYHARLPRSHLRQVHKEFHENKLQVVVATMAFGMGIDKLNVRRIIHYGWPQSLEAYYQEAGRAGRDGKLADCILYANLTRAPTLLPNQRSEDQTKIAYKMLSDCHRYGMNTSHCRAKTLVEYFGEDFTHQKCLMCDVCVKGPPEMLNVKEEIDIFMQILAAHHKHSGYADGSFDEYIEGSAHGQWRFMEKPSLKLLVSKIREQSPKYMTTDMIWWRGLVRIMEDKGYIKEGDERVHVQIKYPQITNQGFDFLQSREGEHFYIYPEADMLLSVATRKSFSTFSEWGKGWADPEIRRQRLASRRKNRKPRKSRRRTLKSDQTTVRGRLSAKILKVK